MDSIFYSEDFNDLRIFLTGVLADLKDFLESSRGEVILFENLTLNAIKNLGLVISFDVNSTYYNSKSIVSLLGDAADSLIALVNESESEFNEHFSNVLVKAYERINGFLEECKVRMPTDWDSQLAALKKSIDEIESRTHFVTRYNADWFQDLMKTGQSHVNEITRLAARANQKFADISDYLDLNAEKIAETVGRLSTDAVSGRFNTRAVEEQSSAEKMKWAAVLLMTLAVALVFLSALNVVPYFGWQDIVIRVVATTTLFVTAGYFANESNKHRKLQHKYERIHLDLSAVDPFIATFDADTQKALKSEVARRVFVTSHTEGVNGVSSDDADIPNNLTDVMQELLKVLKNYNKKES